jgi:polysaccharide biosynthesis protein PslH
MRVLVCAAEAPLPPVNGLRLQLIHLCRELASDHEVCVLAYRWPEQAGAPPAGVELHAVDPPLLPRDRARALLRWLPSGDPLPVAALTAPMAAAAARLIAEREFDVVHVTGSGLARIAPALDGIPAVLAALDAWHLNKAAATTTKPRLLRPLYRLDERRVRRYSKTAYRPYRSVVMVSGADARAVLALDPTLDVEIIPNGVDAESFSPTGGPEEPGLIVFTGAMQWAPNAQAAEFLARDVLPRVRSARPEAHVALVGRNPAPAVQALAELEGVQVTGEVPDVRPWLNRAQAFACVMRSGTGIKNKLLEALACGAACVATPLACQGIEAVHGEHLLVADDAEACADALIALLEDRDLRDRLGRGGRAFVLEHHSWAATGRAYADLYRRVIPHGERVP